MSHLIGRWVLLSWFAVTAAVAGGTGLLHAAPLPLPETAPEAGGVHVIHALAVACGCSGRVLDYLERRGAVADERILLVDADPDRIRRLEARGFAVTPVDDATLSRDHGIAAVPSLVIFGPDGSIAYRGAHAPRPQMAPVDLELLARVRGGDAPPALPILGCAVSRALQARLDPVGFEYPWSFWR